MGHLLLGVDGGGTKCRMRLTDQNFEILGEAIIHSPANLQIRNGDAAHAAIMDLIALVYAQAGLDVSMTKQTHACFGMAGARLQSARDSFVKRGFPFANVKVVDDIDIARAGAHKGEDGAVLIIGTGSAGLGRIAGKRLQIGGWGFLVGDSMAGAALGRELLRRSLLAHEGLIEGSALTDHIMNKFDNLPENLMTWSFENPDAIAEARELAQQEKYAPQTGHVDEVKYISVGSIHARPGDYGKFVPVIFDYFEQDDPMAKQLIEFELAAIDQYVSWFLDREIKSIAVVGGLGQRL
ncbi:MAG: hypothetical protein L3J13_10880, partial [Devosiaceae bacterium]|nr:hypothetical protein [Devosiaceae bacterium]